MSSLPPKWYVWGRERSRGLKSILAAKLHVMPDHPQRLPNAGTSAGSVYLPGLNFYRGYSSVFLAVFQTHAVALSSSGGLGPEDAVN